MSRRSMNQGMKVTSPQGNSSRASRDGRLDVPPVSLRVPFFPANPVRKPLVVVEVHDDVNRLIGRQQLLGPERDGVAFREEIHATRRIGTVCEDFATLLARPRVLIPAKPGKRSPNADLKG